ncbi:hypothetical protein [Haloferax sp. Q22]|uniref:hypothetical protein n=1 Tax=Haloferax sp. (strain Q22) TaxID=1526048 RepID=UPI0031F2EC82
MTRPFARVRRAAAHARSSGHTHAVPTVRHLARHGLIGVVLLSLIAVEPALAQESVICQTDRIPTMISGFFQLTTTVGLIGLVVVWQGNSLSEIFTLSPDQREKIKRHKRTALKSTLTLVLLGPLYTVAGSTMGLPLATCIDLVPI